MTAKEKWKLSSTSLRRLLRAATNVDDASTYGDFYKFGAYYGQGMIYVYNVVTDNVIATVKKSSSRRYVIRYRARSHYAEVIKDFKAEGCRIIFVASENLGRRRNAVRNEARERASNFYRLAQTPRETVERRSGRSLQESIIFTESMIAPNPFWSSSVALDEAPVATHVSGYWVRERSE